MKKYNELMIFDLDSTLSDTRHRNHLSPFVNSDSDWPKYAKACVDDPPMLSNIYMMNTMWEHWGIYLLTGRDIAAHDETRWWLSRHGAKYDFLKMRDTTDIEGNGAYKVKHIKELLDSGYKVHCLFDDWPATVEEVRKSGVNAVCLNPMYVDEAMLGYETFAKADNPL
jgi:hypothetical protein